MERYTTYSSNYTDKMYFRKKCVAKNVGLGLGLGLDETMILLFLLRLSIYVNYVSLAEESVDWCFNVTLPLNLPWFIFVN